ncbi:MAG: DUF3325 domain-containing protein [Pseudomonadota bacterium]
MSWIAAFALALPGFAGLCLSTSKHQRAVFGSALAAPQTRRYRALGWALLCASIVWCMAMFGWARGAVAVCGVVTIAAVSVIGLVTFRPHWVRYLCWVPRPAGDTPAP